jgi:hypothetical protein
MVADDHPGPAVTASTGSTALSLYRLNWWMIGAMAVAFAVGCWGAGFAVTLGPTLYSYGLPTLFGAVAWHGLRNTDPAALRPTTFLIGNAAQVVLVTAIMAPMTYVAAAAAYPLQDAALHRIDQLLGLDWRAYLDFVNQYPWLGAALSRGYTMIGWPIFAIPLVLGLAGHVVRLNQFVLAFGAALAATTLISAFVPAVAAFNYLGLTPADYANLKPLADFDHMRHLPLVRDGTMRELDVMGVTGIVTFPSFHAASCLLYTWAFWPVRWMRPITLAANGLMLASTPIDGGHYFIDVFAGLALAAAAIALVNRITVTISSEGKVAPVFRPISSALAGAAGR